MGDGMSPLEVIILALYSDALDECVVEHQPKLLSSLNQILKCFQAGKYWWLRDSMLRTKSGYSGKVTTRCIVSRRGSILKYLHMRLDEYTPKFDGQRTGSGPLEDSERCF